MIGYLKGKVVDYSCNSATILTSSGVGLNVSCPSRVIKEVENSISSNREISLYISTVVKENGTALYGFLNKQEKKMFETITSVNGIGPKIALEILSNIEPIDFITAISTSDVEALTRIKGVGRKGADKIIFSLKDKVSKEEIPKKIPSQKYEDLLQALIYMGYKSNEAEKIADEVYDQSLSVEELIKKALTSIAKTYWHSPYLKEGEYQAINFLKECIDAGADGFRFDGTKHIEVPTDFSYAKSNAQTALNFYMNYMSRNCIATISRYSSTKGKVTAKKAGTVTITAKNADG